MNEKQTTIEMIRGLLADGEDSERIVKRVVEAISEEEKLSFLHAYIREVVRKTANQDARQASWRGTYRRPPEAVIQKREEFISYAESWPEGVDEADPGERISRRAALLSERFMVHGHGFVLWGDATREQHAARAKSLQKIGASAFETARLHLRAVSEIDAAQVETLNKIVELRHANERQLVA